MYACGVQVALSGLFSVMLGLEDPFARKGGRGQLDSVKVPELVEVARQQLLVIEKESTVGWETPTAKLARAVSAEASVRAGAPRSNSS